MTEVTTGTTNAAKAESGWRMFIYARSMPIECDGVAKDGSLVRCKVKAGEKVQFKIKKIFELTSKKGSLGYKVVCSLRNYYSSEEPLSHAGAFYRIMAITKLSPASGRYIVKFLRVDGDVINRKENELAEYLFGFMEDAINDSIYTPEINFEGKDLLIKLPGIFSGCKLATPVENMITGEFPGATLFYIRVNGSEKKFALKKLKDGKAGIATNSELLAFNVTDLPGMMDQEGFHTDKGNVHVLALTKENLETFKSMYC